MPRWLKAAGPLAALLVMVTSGLASDFAVRKYRNHTPEQIKVIPDQERQREVPMMYILATQKGLAPDANLAITMDLNLLMYPGVNDYIGAVKMFQRDVGDPATGVLTVSQIHKLGVRAEYQKLLPIGFPTQYFSYMSSDGATVKGTWRILDEKIAWPVNHTTVSCYKPQMYCERRTLYLSLPRESDWSRMYSVNELGKDMFRITRWDNQLIDASPLDEDAKCRAVTLNFNFSTKEFFEISRNTASDCDVLGIKMPKLEKPRIAQIVDGTEIVRQEFEDIQRTAYGFLASSFRVQVEKFAKEGSPR